MPIILYLLFMICLGFYQVIHAIVSYCAREKPQAYYTNLRRYGIIVLAYFSIWITASQFPIQWMNNEVLTLMTFSYCLLVPHAIAVYYWNISTEEHYEEIEKLIF